MWPARASDNSAVIVVRNVKVRMETKHSISFLSLYDLLWESFTFHCVGISKCLVKQDRQCTYNVTVWRVRVTIFAMDMQRSNAFCMYC